MRYLYAIVLLTAILLPMGNASAQSESLAQAMATIDEMRAEIQSLKGTVETYQHTINQLKTTVERRVSDQDDRLRAIEDKLEIYDRQVTAAVSSVAPAAAGEAELYQKGLNQIQNSNFLSAVATFQSFLKQYPKSDMAANSQYWIAECYFGMRDYHRAIKEFQNYLEGYPQGKKKASAVLKQGLGFMELNMKEESKPFFNKVIKAFPGTPESSKAKEQLDWMKGEEDRAAKSQNVSNTSSHPGVPLAPGLEDDIYKKNDKKAPKESKGKYD